MRFMILIKATNLHSAHAGLGIKLFAVALEARGARYL